MHIKVEEVQSLALGATQSVLFRVGVSIVHLLFAKFWIQWHTKIRTNGRTIMDLCWTVQIQ